MTILVPSPWTGRLVPAHLEGSLLVCLTAPVSPVAPVIVRPEFAAKSALIQARNFARQLRQLGYTKAKVQR